MAKFIARLWRDRSGAAAVEYALIAALIAVTMFGGLATYYTSMGKTFEKLETKVTPAG